jgi:signal transduction histidine kinase
METVAYAFLAWNVLENNPELVLVKQGLVFRTIIPFILLFFILYFLQAESGLYRDQLEEKNQALFEDRNEKEKLNYTKDKIFSIISHDLRSPMASLHAMLDLLRSSHLSKEEFNKATEGIDSQVSILRNSLDELLTWSKAQLHGINPEPVTIEIKSLALDLVRQHRTLARKKQLFVHSEIAEAVYVCMDKNMLTSAINNLLTNAIKFTPRKGAIHIRSHIKDNFAHLIIEDTGIGIEPANVSKILNPTELFTTRGTENEKGTGLGLSMISEFMNRNGGKLCIESVHKSGSRFTLVIPLA